MATAVSYRHGTEAQHRDFRGVLAEITVSTDEQTLYVHDGSSETPGTPLARADLYNVNSDAIKNKGILDNLLTNFNGGHYTNIVNNKNSELGEQISNYLDLINVLNLSTDFAKSDLSNVSRNALTLLAGSTTFIAYDLSNIRTSVLAGENPGLVNPEKPLAYKDMSNVNTEYLAVSDENHNHTGKNLAYADLTNISPDSTALPIVHQYGIEITNNLIDVNNATAGNTDQYPTAISVKTELDTINNKVKILDISVPDPSTGVVRVTLSQSTTIPNIHFLYTASNISGTWTTDVTNNKVKIFTPLDPTNITNEAWVITI